jgi:uncharacterized protein (TIGR02598 family)
MKRSSQQRGFSLIEVVIALGIAVFCLIPIFALLPIGQKSNQDTLRETIAASLAASVSTDLRATPATITSSPYFGLSIPSSGSAGTTNNFYVTDTGVTNAAPSTSRATYLATVVITPPAASTPKTATTAQILITWPALPNQANGSIPTQYVGSYDTVIGLNRN